MISFYIYYIYIDYLLLKSLHYFNVKIKLFIKNNELKIDGLNKKTSLKLNVTILPYIK